MPLSRKRVNLANGLFKVDCKHTMELFFFCFFVLFFLLFFCEKENLKRRKKNPWNLHFSFKLRKGASVQSSLRCMVNCLQWLLCVALCFPRLMKCLTNTCLKMISTKNVVLFSVTSFYLKKNEVIWFAHLVFDALNIIYVHLTNYKKKRINLIYPWGWKKIYIQNVCVFHVSFLVVGWGWGKSLKSLFNFYVVLSTMSDYTFAMILIAKA